MSNISILFITTCVLLIFHSVTCYERLEWTDQERVFGPRFHGPMTYNETLPKFFAANNMTLMTCVHGYGHSLCLTKNGEVYAWGLGEDGQLGDGNNANARGTPVRVALPDDVVIKFISAGHDYSLAVDGCVEKKLHSVPCKVVLPIDVKIARVSAGHSHSIAVDGQLGTWEKRDWSVPKLVHINDIGVGTIDDVKIVDVCAGGSHSVIQMANGLLYTTGWNMMGQLGLADTTDRDKFEPVHATFSARSMYCGASYTVALDTDGHVWAWGDAAYLRFAGLIDNGTKEAYLLPIMVPNYGVSFVPLM